MRRSTLPGLELAGGRWPGLDFGSPWCDNLVMANKMRAPIREFLIREFFVKYGDARAHEAIKDRERGLIELNRTLSDAQDVIGRYMSDEETKRYFPRLYEFGDEAFSVIKRLRLKIAGLK